jgi:hypothetical protein
LNLSPLRESGRGEGGSYGLSGDKVMNMIRRLCLVLLICCAIAGPAATGVRATIVVPADFAELTVEAGAIAHGRIVRVEARQDDRLRVERLVTLQVLEYFKGGWGNVVQFRMPGGTLGRYQTVMIGSPDFAEGDEVVLFLGSRPDDDRERPARPYVLGMHQGVYRVIADQSTGRRMVTPPLVLGAGVEGASSPTTPTKRGDVNRVPVELREFQGRIAAALAAPRVARAAVGGAR